MYDGFTFALQTVTNSSVGLRLSRDPGDCLAMDKEYIHLSIMFLEFLPLKLSAQALNGEGQPGN